MPAPKFRVLLLAVIGTGLMSACGTAPTFVAEDEPWRAAEERACVASGVVHETSFVRSRSALGGPSVCGAEHPFEMSAANGGRVRMKPAALLRCPMIPQVDRWVSTVIAPAALETYGVPLAEIKVAASYGCRPMNNVTGARLSEHGHANALDVSAFILADGTTITVKKGWSGELRERTFLRTVHNGACNEFTTVLGPNYDKHHRDHFHVDLARRGKTGLNHVCK